MQGQAVKQMHLLAGLPERLRYAAVLAQDMFCNKGIKKIEFSFQPDPVSPAQEPEKPQRKAVTTSTPRAPRATNKRKEAALQIEAYLQMIALPWSLADSTCAGALSETSNEIANRLADVLAHNPKLLDYITSSGMFADIGKLIIALWPLSKALYSHHLAGVGVGDPGINLDDFPGFEARR